MVEKLKIRHPEFAKRLRDLADPREIEVKHIAKLPGFTYEMARRYWIGAAKPRGKKMEALAELVGASASHLEYGTRNLIREPASPYTAGVSIAALDVARAWSKLSPSMQRLYREAIFRDAATENVLPFLKTLVRPTGSSYDAFEKSVERDYHEHMRQLKLEI